MLQCPMLSRLPSWAPSAGLIAGGRAFKGKRRGRGRPVTKNGCPPHPGFGTVGVGGTLNPLAVDSKKSKMHPEKGNRNLLPCPPGKGGAGKKLYFHDFYTHDLKSNGN